MVIRHISRIVVFMAIDTAEKGKIPRSGMTINALIPFAVMSATVYGEIILIVVPGGRIPGVRGMTILTRGRKLSRNVIRVIGGVIISGVAPETVGGRVIVIAIYVAIITISCYMRPG